MRSIVAVALVVAAFGALPAAAAPPPTATFSVIERFDSPNGLFASGGSIVCASGTTANDTFATGFQSDRGVIFHVRKTITCNDGSGTFTLLIQARSGFDVGDITFGPWIVLDGTGDYATLRGRGTVTGTFIPGGVSDVYTGWLAVR